MNSLIYFLIDYGATEVTAGSHIMLPQDLVYGQVGVPLHSFKYYLKDWPEGEYFTTDKPNPRGEVVLHPRKTFVRIVTFRGTM